VGLDSISAPKITSKINHAQSTPQSIPRSLRLPALLDSHQKT
jgi:hypothetical protein